MRKTLLESGKASDMVGGGCRPARRLGEPGRPKMSRSCSAAALAFSCIASAAAAQDAGSSVPSAQAAASAPTGRLEEIVVTAQHRSERLQDVPVAVTSLSAAALSQQGVSTTSDLSQATPSLVFNSQVAVANPYIRGVGSDLFDPTSEAAVAIYVDDVYMATPQANLFTLAGTKQIDVLNGPQGTLFGRNATGGVIQIQTLDPGRDPHLDASFTYGNYDTLSASVYGSTGVAHNLSTSLSALYENQGQGYGHNLATGAEINKQAIHNIALRNKWVLDLPTNTVIHVSADYSRTNNSISYQRPVGSFSTLPGATEPTGYPGPFNANIDLPDALHVRSGGVSLKVDQDLGAVSLVSISAYRASRDSYSLDQDQTILPVVDITWDTKFRNFSQELRLKNRDNPVFNWMVGAFYYNARGSYNNFAVDGTVYVPFDQQRTESVAGFAQATVKLFANTKLTGGVRYTEDKQHFLFPAGDLFLKQTVKEPTFRAALDQHFTKNILGYVSFNTGFKSGGYTLLQPGNSYKPEKLRSYEAGLKTEWFDHRLRVNIDGFIYRYTNQQVNVSAVGGNIIANAAGSHIKGFEANFDYVPTSRLKFSGGLSLMDGHYTDYPGYQPRDADGNAVGGPINAKGATTSRTPKFVGNVSAQYKLPTPIGDFVANVGVQHNSGYDWVADDRLRQPRYTIVNTSVSWTPNDGRLILKLWAKNLSNATYYQIQGPSAYPVGDNQVQAPPRTFGGTVSFHY